MKRWISRPVALSVLLTVSAVLAGCGKAPSPEASPTPTPTPEPTATPAPTPTATPEPTPTPIDLSSQVSVLGYHRFEAKPRDPLAMTPEHFRRQLEAIRASGVPVIPMADFLAWRRGEKAIPPQAIVITIDDGYDDTYSLAWPILKEFGYPFTFYVYLKYISAGGRSITWEELAEMAAAGVDIASHTVAHDSLVRPKTKPADMTYDEWLWNELKGSKEEIEKRLGVTVTTLAYPYGVHNDTVAAKALEAGYEAAFTVNGQKALHASPAARIGRYIVQSDKEFTFTNSLKFGGSSGSAPSAVAEGNPAAATMITLPAQGSTIADPRPELKINLAALGAVDPKSVEMRISGFGLVPATFDAESKTLSYRLHNRLRETDVTVIVNARAGGRRVSTNWSFRYDPNADAPAPTPGLPPPVEAPLPGEDEVSIPPMKPAE